VVELESDNKARNMCKGAMIVRLPDGTTIDPCPHEGTAANRQRCLLETFRVSQTDRGRYLVRRGDRFVRR
jgi:hypothetical protein